MRVTIVVTVDDDENRPAGEIHEAVIEALDLSGFRQWTSYVAADAIPPPRIAADWPRHDDDD